MDKMTEFKAFVKEKPELVRYVRNGEMTWQKFYELYDLYGTKEDVWQPYQKETKAETTTKEATTFGVGEILGWLKTVDLDSLQNGISSMQRVLGVLQDFGNKEETATPEYKPRPLYRQFED